jgi:hypothetical protein
MTAVERREMKYLTIGQVAQRAGPGIETVRFYEWEGLLNRPARSPSSGYRLYGGGTYCPILEALDGHLRLKSREAKP